jgi:hypothetical protein
LDWKASRRAKVLFWLRASFARPSKPDFCAPRIRLSDRWPCPDWRGWSWMFRQPIQVEKRIPILTSSFLLETMMEDRLPGYSDGIDEIATLLLEVAKDGEKK